MHRSKNRSASIEGLREAPLVSRLLAGAALALLATILIVPASSLAQSVTGTGGINLGIPAPPLASWNVGADLDVGRDADGALTIADGGTVTSQAGRIRYSLNRTGTVTVTGAGSARGSGSDLSIGHFGTGHLTITGGSVSSITTVLGSDAGSTGTLDLLGSTAGGRGVLETGQLVAGPGSATLNLDGGVFRATRDEASYLDSFTALTIGNNGAFIDSNGHNIGIATDFSGPGGLTKLGAGPLILSGANSYTGDTVIAAGRLVGDSVGSFSLSSNVAIAAGAPGASFKATGARRGSDSALVSAGILARLSGNVSFGLNLDGELSANDKRLGGAAQLRVSF